MRRAIALSTTALTLTAGFVAPAAASTPQPTHGPEIDLIEVKSVSGPGCPVGTVGAKMAPDYEAFVLYFSDYTVQAGGDSKPADARKNCQVTLKVNTTSKKGFTYAVTQVALRGSANLQTRVDASLASTYGFQDGQQTDLGRRNLRGPYDDNFEFNSGVVPAPVWKPCGQDPTFNISTDLRVTGRASAPEAVSSASLSTFDGSIKSIYYLTWQRCP